eukprot:m.112866 g.112866  ORF g.112866 m.112866 type:complete len:373 (-) comp14107_c0_seq1:74-1192(-)
MFKVPTWDDGDTTTLFGTEAISIVSKPQKKRKRTKSNAKDTIKKSKITRNIEQSSTENSSVKQAAEIKNITKIKKKIEKKRRNPTTEGLANQDETTVVDKVPSGANEKKTKKKKKKKNVSDISKESNHNHEETDFKNNSSVKPVTMLDQSKRQRGKNKSAVERLKGAKFRMLNEKLYTTTGDNAFSMFSEEPNLFDIYHEGFAAQVEKWPVNPVSVVISWIKQHPPKLVVADLGCGEAAIASSVPNTVHSFDLVARNEKVVACDIAHVPLGDCSVDIAVFCLALMGTNHMDYIREARRILKPKGIMKIAEVVSRITDYDEFCKSIESTGFKLQEKDDSNQMFIIFDFKRIKGSTSETSTNDPILTPCIYKRR